MTVYIDEIIIWPRARGIFRQGSSHLTTDDLTLEELHAFARTLGLRRSWFQRHAFAPHYDIVPRIRIIALAKGAVFMATRTQSVMRRTLGIGAGAGLETWESVALKRKQ